MFCSHINQAVVLKHGEIPHVFTNFENQVGKYSSAYKVSDRNWIIIAKIVKNPLNSLYIVKDEEGYVDVIQRQEAERITEHYGYTFINENLDSKTKNDTIEKDEILYHSTSYDKDLNFTYGVNLKSIYLTYKNLTFEDAVVISESAAEKLKYYQVQEYTININNNDLLTNLYGNENFYKAFPDIGEFTNNRILLARRRINYDSILFDLSTKNLMNVNWNSDGIFYGEGKVIDVNVYSNADLEKLEKYPYNDQIVKYLKENIRYYEKIVEVLEPIIKRKKKNYSDDIGYIYKRA
ncbi:MAG: hypothetical protein WC123_07985, partial [Bacilli bacterium]